MFGALLAAANAAKGVGGVGGAITGLFGGTSSAQRDAQRSQQDQRSMAAALAGSVVEARRLWGDSGTAPIHAGPTPRHGAATAASKASALAAWQQIVAQRPDVAAAAQAAGPLSQGEAAAMPSGTAVPPLAPPPTAGGGGGGLRGALDALWREIRGDAADTALQVAAGAGTQASGAIRGAAPGGGVLVPVSAPSSGTLLLFAGVGLAVWLIARGHR